MEAYTIESAGISLESLMRFYTEDERETLPIPDYQSLRAALDAYSLLTVTDDDGGGVVAAAGYFEYARSSDTCMIYELAGTRVKNTIGRLKGISLQQILIALRVLQVAATEAGPLSLISSARNPRSIGNLSVLGLQEIAPLPTWLNTTHAAGRG